MRRREMLKLGLVCFQLPMSVQLATHEVGATAARGMKLSADVALVSPTPYDSRHRSLSARILTPSERWKL